MDLLTELYDIMIYYLSVEDLSQFRVTAKDSCKEVKRYEGVKNVLIYPASLRTCLQCFPNLKYLDATKCTVHDVELFSNVKELVMTTQYLDNGTFRYCSNLTTLQLIANGVEPIDYAFQSLGCLRSLSLCNVSIPDHALVYLSQLEELNLYDQSLITSEGINGLQLKRLHISTPLNAQSSLIRDHAFEGLSLKQLILENQEWITDQGILHLTQLKRLFCVKTRIQGIGFTSLKNLQTVGIGGVTVTDVSGFIHIRTLSFNDCKCACTWEGNWKNLKKLRFHETTFTESLSIKKIVAPQLQQLRYTLCAVGEHEHSLRETFGTRLMIRSEVGEHEHSVRERFVTHV